MKKKIINRYEKIKVRLSESDRDLIIDNTFIEQEYIHLLKSAIPESGYITIRINIDDLDFILGHIAASANHAENQNLQKSLYEVYDYLTEIESKYEVIDY